MAFLLTVFALLQAIGAILGAGGSVLSELEYFRAIRDGRIDRAEREHLNVVARALRWGMLALLIGSIGLVLVDFASGALQPALTSAYWSEMALALIIILTSWALARNRVPFWFGSGVAFTAWWLIALMDLGQIQALSLGALIAVYVVATAVVCAFLGYLRSWYRGAA